MTHFTDEQLEEMLDEQFPSPPHLTECPDCRARLAGRRAVRSRLQSAFAAVGADESFAERLRGRLAGESAEKPAPAHSWRGRIFHLPRRFWPAVAAAVVLLAAVPVGLRFLSPATASADQKALAEIHRHNLSAHGDYYSDADPKKLAEYLKKELGFTLAMPRPGQGMSLRGCCVRHFRDKVVGSYVVATPRGVVSVIAVTDRPESLGKSRRFQHRGRALWASSFADNNMVALRLGDLSYCAVGEVPHDTLTELLSLLTVSP